MLSLAPEMTSVALTHPVVALGHTVNRHFEPGGVNVEFAATVMENAPDPLSAAFTGLGIVPWVPVPDGPGTNVAVMAPLFQVCPSLSVTVPVTVVALP
jgi:hypothetical protein